MTFDGRIIEYLEEGKFICAFVYEDTGSRLRLFNQNSREITLPLNRIIHSTSRITPVPSKEEARALLQSLSEQRAELADSINLDEIWEIASEKSEDIFEVDFLAGLYFGNEPSGEQCAAFLRAVITNRIYFKYKAGSIHIHSPETVEQIKLKQQQEKEQEDFITRNTEILRRIWETGEPLQDWDEGGTTLKILADCYLFDKEAAGYGLARKLLKNAGLNGPHDIFHLLVKAGVWDKNENIPLLRLELPTSFSEEAMTEAEKIRTETRNDLFSSGRKDFRNLPVFTIDGPSTRDFDDALHLEKQGENYLVGIHISDVGLSIKQGTALFAEALNRGTSIYFPEGPLTMLPPSLSEDSLSLLKDRVRPTLSFLVLLSPKAEVLRFEIVHAIVSVKQQLTYSEADSLIKQDKEMAALAALSILLRQRRVNNGALLLPMPELHISIGDNDSIEINRYPVDTSSKILIAEFMILANTLGAQFVAEREAPGLFRCQPEPRQRIIDGFENDITKIIQQRKRLSPMSLLTTPKGHSGVGAPHYTTVTSPIRRLLDLIMQLQISYLVMGQGILFSKKDMKSFGSKIQLTLEKANQAKYLRQRYWILKYLQKKQERKLPVLVIDSGPKRVHVFLEEFLLDADLPFNPAFKVNAGDTILVRIAKIDPLGNILRLEW
jgi:exoribonuclease II